MGTFAVDKDVIQAEAGFALKMLLMLVTTILPLTGLDFYPCSGDYDETLELTYQGQY